MGQNAATAKNGNLGKAVVDDTLVLRLTQWNFTSVTTTTEWGDSDSAGFMNTKAARRNATGTITAKFDTGRKPYNVLREGDNLNLVLWEDATDYWAFPRVVITSFNLVFDPNTKEVVEWTADWTADNVFYAPGESGAPTETLPTS